MRLGKEDEGEGGDGNPDDPDAEMSVWTKRAATV